MVGRMKLTSINISTSRHARTSTSKRITKESELCKRKRKR